MQDLGAEEVEHELEARGHAALGQHLQFPGRGQAQGRGDLVGVEPRVGAGIGQVRVGPSFHGLDLLPQLRGERRGRSGVLHLVAGEVPGGRPEGVVAHQAGEPEPVEPL